MKNIIIAGAGGCGREVLEWIFDINEKNPTWNIKGFIADDKDTALAGHNCNVNVIGTIKDYVFSEDDVCICAIGSPQGKKTVVKYLREKGAKFTSVIHPKAVISQSANIGEGFIAYPYSVVGANTTIGNFVTLLSSTVGYDTDIGDFTTISSYCSISNETRLGACNELGSHVSLKDGIVIGDETFIAAGSFVAESFPDGHTRLWGNPAQKLVF